MMSDKHKELKRGHIVKNYYTLFDLTLCSDITAYSCCDKRSIY